MTPLAWLLVAVGAIAAVTVCLGIAWIVVALCWWLKETMKG